jgi:hypothetical protein
MTAWIATALMLTSATVFDDQFDRGTEAYANRDYATAVAVFEQLIDGGVDHPAVFYNLGNAYYRLGWLGPAIANYERALRLAPGMENAQQNLRHCIARTERRLDRPLPPEWEQSLLFWHYGLAPRTTFLLAAVCWMGAWLVLGVRQWRRAPGTRPMRRTALLAGVLAVLAIAFGGSAWVKAHPAMLAVASNSVVSVRYGPDDTDTERFRLYEGDRIVVDRRRNGWSRVTTSTGERGWARDQGLAFVGPPYERPPDPQAELTDGGTDSAS